MDELDADYETRLNSKINEYENNLKRTLNKFEKQIVINDFNYFEGCRLFRKAVHSALDAYEEKKYATKNR